MADLEKTVFKNKVHTTRSDVFGQLVILAFLLLMLETALRATRWRSLA